MGAARNRGELLGAAPSSQKLSAIAGNRWLPQRSTGRRRAGAIWRRWEPSGRRKEPLGIASSEWAPPRAARGAAESRTEPPGAARRHQEPQGAAWSCQSGGCARPFQRAVWFGVYSRAGMLVRACFGSIWCWVLTFLLVRVLPHCTFNSSAKWHVFWRRGRLLTACT